MAAPLNDPLAAPRADYEEILGRISLQDSPVGIDAQYTHAVIIQYLRQIEARVLRIEQMLEARP